MFRRLLVANRGEIACRVLRTARRLGLHTIAVYSDADRDARHVRLADEAWRLGPAEARESYLSVERVLEVARAAGAEAVHPGYGFLSENEAFVRACAAAGIVFVGPPADAIAAMGSKRAAKDAMARAGVPVLPGYHGAAQDLESLAREARAVGFPLIVKPSGGGGGKGMHVVERAEQLAGALAGARRLAESAFADPTLLVERYVPAPRHVEVQVLLDGHGTALQLGTRDCSVQRRHQKLIEEAPAPGIADEVRARLHAAALTVARAVGYVNAGTVEFLYADGEFWFMEMNTRLQVEHPVTEAVYGLDLVEWQLRVAAGERLPFAQEALVARGHAIEVRVTAEDAAADFAPSAGRLARLDWPREDDGVRVDAGFESGDLVPTQYDSLLGKVIASGPDRRAALARLGRALDELRIVGVAHGGEWLARALARDSFAQGAVSTRFLAEEGAALPPPPPSPEELALAALAVVHGGAAPEPAASPWATRDAFRLNLPAVQRLTLAHGADEIDIEVESRPVDAVRGGAVNAAQTSAWQVRVADARYDVDWQPFAGGARVHSGAASRRIEFERAGDRLHLWQGARHVVVRVVDRREVDPGASVHEGELVARLPGTVVAVAVEPGARVEAGATLLVLEAMKMEHAVLAPRAGIVRRVHAAHGERVAEGALLVELEPVEAPAADGAEPHAPRT